MSRSLFLHLILFVTISIISFVSVSARYHKLHVVSHGGLKNNDKLQVNISINLPRRTHQPVLRGSQRHGIWHGKGHKYGHGHRKKKHYGGQGLAVQFLAAHNTVRQFLHLKPLKWNRTLARYSRHWAYERSGDCRLQHSPNSPYGENMFWSQNGHWTPLEVVKCWASEYKLYNSATNECVGNSVCGHYTQIIWRNTRHIGCGRSKCAGNKGFIYVCSYDPPGNFYFEGPLGGHFTKSIVYPPPPGKS